MGLGGVIFFNGAIKILRTIVLRSSRMRYQTTSFETQMSAAELQWWLTGKALLSSRRLVLRLMLHTQALNSGSHCPQAVRPPAAPQCC